MPPQLTAGEECRACGQALSAFAGTTQSAIPRNFVSMAMAMAIFKGASGVAIVRLRTGDWSAPCAIMLEHPQGTEIQSGQDTVLLFMTEGSVLSLVSRTRLVLNSTHKFEAGPYGIAKITEGVDIYGYVRFNGSFTPSELIQQHMTGWGVREDWERHSRWHGPQVTWADVLMNKISVDRSSIGNTLYVVANMAAGGTSTGVIEFNGKKNFADLDKLVITRGLDTPKQQQQQQGAATPTAANLGIANPVIAQQQQQQQQQQLQQQFDAQQQQLMALQQQQQQELARQQQLQYQIQLQQLAASGNNMMGASGLTPQQQQMLLLQQQGGLSPQQQQMLLLQQQLTPQQQLLLLQQQQQQQQQQAQQQLMLLQQQARGGGDMMTQAREAAIQQQIQQNLEDQIKALNEQTRMMEKQQEAIRNAMMKR